MYVNARVWFVKSMPFSLYSTEVSPSVCGGATHDTFVDDTNATGANLFRVRVRVRIRVRVRVRGWGVRCRVTVTVRLQVRVRVFGFK
jgi:hypothetical protein